MIKQITNGLTHNVPPVPEEEQEGFRPIRVGIVGWKIGPNSFGITLSYLSYFDTIGTVDIINPLSLYVNHDIDLLVLPGGGDVDSMRYSEKPDIFSGRPDPFLEFFDTQMLKHYISKRTPIFGICRGFQTLNIFFGGRLSQEISGIHDSSDPNKRYETAHEVLVVSKAVEKMYGKKFKLF